MKPPGLRCRQYQALLELDQAFEFGRLGELAVFDPADPVLLLFLAACC